jgi:putative exosortase-associated protein (TIGR04073 family)
LQLKARMSGLQDLLQGQGRSGAGVTLGFAEGLGAVVVRDLVGVYEFVTAPFPVPRRCRPIIEPEYPWDDFRS